MIGYGGRTRWTQPEIRSTPPVVLEAARWELYADRLWPGDDIVASIEAPSKPPTEQELYRQKVAARARLNQLKRQLLPPDEVKHGR